MNKSDWQQHLIDQQAHFSDPESLFIDTFGSVKSIAETCITPLLYQGVLSISGPDSSKFLQGQLTCDLNSVTAQQSILGAACSPQGRMYSSFRVINNDSDNEPGYLLRMRSDLINSSRETLHKYSVFFKTQLNNANDEWLGLGIWGENSESLLRDVLKVTEIPLLAGHTERSESAIVIRLPGSPARFECWVKADHILDIWQSLSTVACPTSNHAWLLEDIRNGIAEVSQPTESAFNPHMLNFQAIDAISFKKGCYTGQEIVARTHYRGKSKRHMLRFKLTGGELLSPGSELHAADSDRTIATVVSAARSESNTDTSTQEALLVVNADLDSSTPLTLQQDTQQFQAVACPLPYTLNE